MNKLYLLIAVLCASVVAQAAEVVGSVEAEVVTASCAEPKAGLGSFWKKPSYECRLWIESEYGQQHINIKLDHPVKRGDKLTLVQTSDNEYTVM